MFDHNFILRRALWRSLTACDLQFRRIWHEHEIHLAADQYYPNEEQLQRDWRSAVAAAGRIRESILFLLMFFSEVRCKLTYLS